MHRAVVGASCETHVAGGRPVIWGRMHPIDVSPDPLEERLRQIPEDKEIEVLEEFLFQLTIAFRASRSIEGLSDDDLIRALRMINEINHRVLNRIRELRSGKLLSFPNYVAEIVKHHVGQAPAIAGWVGTAIDKALRRYDA